MLQDTAPRTPAPRDTRRCRARRIRPRPGRRRMSIPRRPPTISEAGGTGAGYGRMKPDLVEPTLRDAGTAWAVRHRETKTASTSAYRRATRMEPGQPDEGDERHPPRTSVSERLPRGGRGSVPRLTNLHRQDDDAALENWEIQGAGTDGDEAAEQERLIGACSGDPSEPSPTTNLTLRISISATAASPRGFGEGRDPLDRQKFAAEVRENRRPAPRLGPDLEDLLRPRKPEARPSSAIMYGWEIVCPSPMGTGLSAYARCRTSGTRGAGQSFIAEMMCSLQIPRRQLFRRRGGGGRLPSPGPFPARPGSL